jgi:hypothetical protein
LGHFRYRENRTPIPGSLYSLGPADWRLLPPPSRPPCRSPSLCFGDKIRRPPSWPCHHCRTGDRLRPDQGQCRVGGRCLVTNPRTWPRKSVTMQIRCGCAELSFDVRGLSVTRASPAERLNGKACVVCGQFARSPGLFGQLAFAA